MLFVEDNGIGINEYDLEHYVAHVGNSYYTSEEFKQQHLKYEPISQFGIGLCSCFRVSRAILIESRKDKAVNTAWNVSDRQLLDPVAVKWFNGAESIEYINSSRTLPGTRVTLALLPKFAKQMTFPNLVDTIRSFMSCQPIAIDIFYDNKKTTLYQNKMEIEPFAYVGGITTLHIDNDLLEGYITLYNSKHKYLIGESELFQQGFKITEKASDIPLKPEWIRYMYFRLNIKKRFLNLKMSRDGIAYDENFRQLREAIGQLIVGYYQKNPLSLGQYLEDSEKCVLSEYENEMVLVQQAAYVHVFLRNQDVELRIDIIINGFLGSRIKIAYMSYKLFQYFRDGFSVDFKTFLTQYDLIVFEKNRDMFTQFLTPYLEQQRYVVSEIPGLIYTELAADIHMWKNIAPYRWSTQLHPVPIVDDELFCFVTNEQRGPFRLTLNEGNRNALMLERASINPKVAAMREIIVENIKQRIINAQKSWGKIVDFGGSFVDEWTADSAISVQSVWCLEENFAELLNEFVRSRLSYVELTDYGLEELVFRKEDFISWWYMPQ
jgi:hypothetical protein